MAARKRKLTLDEDWKLRIKASVLVDRLTKHVEGTIDMKPTQVRAAEILLKKVAPDLANIDGTVTHDVTYEDLLEKVERERNEQPTVQ